MVDISKLTHVLGDDVDKYFEFKNNRVRFIGDTLEMHIPMRFSTYGLLEVSNSVVTMGVGVLIIDNKYYTNSMILNMIEIMSTSTSTAVVDNVPYVIVYLQKGDIFINSDLIVQDPSLVYKLWAEFLSRGKALFTFKKFELVDMYEHTKELSGISLGIDHSVYEGLLSQLFRVATDLHKLFRLSDMKGDPKLVPIRSIQYTPTTTTTRLIGSYFGDGKMAALLNDDTENNKFEDLYRSVPILD